jgi:glycosyltransferase involved in cell wall biosynthesis
MRGALRILHVLHSFPPYSRGGTERYVEQLARAQLARGDEVSVLHALHALDGAETETTDAVEARVTGLRVLRVPAAPVLGGRALVDPTLPGRRDLLAALLARERADLVHVHHLHGLDLRFVSLARATGSATVVSLHDHFASCARFFRVPASLEPCPDDQSRANCARCLERDAPGQFALLETLLAERERVLHAELGSAGARLAVSASQRRVLAALPALHGLAFETVELPWADAPPLAATRAPRGGVDLSIATWGGLVPGKGLRVLVDACGLLPDPSRVDVHHYGDVLDREHAEACRAAAHGFRLELHGRFESAELGRIGERHDLAVFPSLYVETHGYTVDEALGLGMPVLVSDRGAPPARIGARGAAFAAGDAAALARLLLEFVEQPRRLDALRAGAHAPRVTLAAHLARLDAVYARARSLNGSRARP